MNNDFFGAVKKMLIAKLSCTNETVIKCVPVALIPLSQNR